jgi:hypothetical protein
MATSDEARHAIQLKLAAEVLRSFGELRLAALGSSMVPSIFPGDQLLIRRLSASEIQRDDIVLCTRGDRFIVHRVVGKVRDRATAGWITRGDGLTEDDPVVSECDLLGRVTLIERNGRQWFPLPPSRFAQFLRWAVGHSSIFLRLVLSWHSLQGRFGWRELSAAAFDSLRENPRFTWSALQFRSNLRLLQGNLLL